MAGFGIILSTILNSTLSPGIGDVPFNEGLISTESKVNMVKAFREELNGRHLKVGTIENYPLSYTIRINDTLRGKGVAFEIFDILQKTFNFTYDVFLPKENLEGSISQPENSLLGMLNKKEIDLAVGFLPKLIDSHKFVKYSQSLDEGEWVIMMKRPRESASGSGLLAPFDQNVWYLILVSVIIFGPFIYIAVWVRYILTKDQNNKPYGMSPCLWFVYGALIKQGTTLSPDANTTRILFATWWIFITLLSAFYTANLTAFLTLSKFTLSINEPDDLVSKNNKWMAKKGSAVEYVVTNSNEPLYKLNDMVQKKLGVFQSDSKDIGYLPFIQADYVYVRDKPAVEHLMYNDYKNKTKHNIEEKNRCTYVTTTKVFMKRARAFAYPTNSNLHYLFDPVLLSLVQSGIISFKMRYDLPANQICPLNLKSNERRLRNSDLAMTYLLAGFGIVMSMLVFIFEVFLKNWKRICTHSFVKKFERFEANEEKSPTSKIDKLSPGPPPYQSIFGETYESVYNSGGKRQNINGREYWVLKLPNGDTRLIPVRTPSAFLFQYTT
ncbi:ionotropic receptor 76b [Arctopsyche grandis]|uniref:ionotropic receptor 76b n=1 Tax=Arctopsyche grandis TaxID=121162 RepID=UPI00406D99AF